MSILEILKLEEENKKGIILHKEGLFWRAYEQSAYRFAKYLKPYKVTKKMFKGAKKEIVYLGFPHNVLDEILNQNKGKEINKTERLIEIAEFETVINDFIEWKSKIEILIPNPISVGLVNVETMYNKTNEPHPGDTIVTQNNHRTQPRSGDIIVPIVYNPATQPHGCDIINEKTGSYKSLPGVIEKLRRFPVMNKTPLECQIFLNELQNQINGNV